MKPGREPFRIVPWQTDFLAALKDIIHESTDGRSDRAVVVFPHSRPRRYLVDYYRRDGRLPLLLPRMLTAAELISGCRLAWSGGRMPQRMASRLDQVALLKTCVDEVAASLPADNPLRSIAGGAGMLRFFPWGVRLASLLEECFRQLVGQVELHYVQGEVEPFAAALLEQLRHIREKYVLALSARDLGTPGRDAAFVAAQAGEKPVLPDFLRGRTLILAGFVRLARAEDALFRYLWEAQTARGKKGGRSKSAVICLHSDPLLMEEGGHWSCRDHREWIEDWKAPWTIVTTQDNQETETGKLIPQGNGKSGPEVFFFAGYDLHSQLRELKKMLAVGEKEAGNPVSRAVVLPHSGLLMPTLHNLPSKDVNISLGYPLERSLLARLLEDVFRLRESRRPDGRVHWQPLMDLFGHPYVRMLRPPVNPDQADPPEGRRVGSLRPLLAAMEKRIRSGPRLVDPHELMADALRNEDAARTARLRRTSGGIFLPGNAAGALESGPANEDENDLFEHLLTILVDNWVEMDSLRQAAESLSGVCDLLLEYGGHIWSSFPIDAECLYRLMNNLIPGLEDNSLAGERLGFETLFAIIRQALAEERVPFEADPLTGLQVLGMLETRLLTFERVYILDATEDSLPGAPQHDPLLPDSLRGALGLPDTRERDRLAAHTFRRLLAGASEVRLLWQEGVETSGLLDSKKVRSRFVEEAVWEVEKARKKRLRPGQTPLGSAIFPVTAPPLRTPRPVPRTAAAEERMRAILSEPLAPTRLDSYLRCPVRFYYESVCRILPLDEVREGDDPMEAGRVLHQALLKAYEPYVGKEVLAGQPDPVILENLFSEELVASGLEERLPAESWLMFRQAGPYQLRRFLERQPKAFTLLEVERRYQAGIRLVGKEVRQVFGIMDRVDARPEGEIILDYKSGSVPAVKSTLWREEGLWRAMESWSADAGEADPLPVLAQAVGSLQLPCYLYLYREDAGGAPTNAAWVALAEGGKEYPLFPPKMKSEDIDEALKIKIPSLLSFVLRHMALSGEFRPHPGRHCEWCPYREFC